MVYLLVSCKSFLLTLECLDFMRKGESSKGKNAAAYKEATSYHCRNRCVQDNECFYFSYQMNNESESSNCYLFKEEVESSLIKNESWVSGPMNCSHAVGAETTTAASITKTVIDSKFLLHHSQD